jgi:hypothetical protein
MTDLDKALGFASMMGHSATQVSDGENSIVFFTDECVGDKVVTLGYDDIKFLAEFNNQGELIQAFHVSHVAYFPDGYCDLFERYTRLTA